MEMLREIIQVVDQNGLKKRGRRSIEASRMKKMYQEVLKGNLKSDEETSFHFFHKSEQSSIYKKLKHQLNRDLLDHVFLVDTQATDFSDYDKLYVQCYKDWTVSKILIASGAKHSGLTLAKKVHQLAVKHEFSELAMEAARVLRLHFGSLLGDEEKFIFYHESYSKQQGMFLAESKAQEFYTRLVLLHNNVKIDKEEIQKAAKRYLNDLKQLSKKTPTIRFQTAYFLIQLIFDWSNSDYQKMMITCESALDFLNSKKLSSSKSKEVFVHQKLICCIQLKRFMEGFDIAAREEGLYKKGSFNWYKHQEMLLSLALHSGQYQKAYEVFYKVLGKKSIQKLPVNIKETWKLFEIYLHYLVVLEKISPEKTDKRFNKIKLGRFLNEVPSFSKDKSGMNIPILIIQILFLILKKDFSLAIERLDSIQKYCSRHLKKDATYRSNCFIKMLLQIGIASFHKNGSQRKAEKYLKKLKETPLEVSTQTFRIEVLPFEDLWQLALESLEARFHKFRK